MSAAAFAFRLLFYRTGEEGLPLPPDDLFLRQSETLLDGKDIAEKLNLLSRESSRNSFAENFSGKLFEAFAAAGILPPELDCASLSEDAEFLLKHAAVLIYALKSLTDDLTVMEKELLRPRAKELFDLLPAPAEGKEAVIKFLKNADPFRSSRVFSWHGGRFIPVSPSSVKSVEKFFGFPGVRLALQEHFSNFSKGTTSLPLLINSLPGYGKTSMVISFALSVPETVVILADQEALENSWHDLISTLARRKDHRFVLFFDDLDPRAVDWYTFRTNVGGAFTPPENIMPVLTANYEFPASILSRGRRISYPVFDEERCLEMIEDFLGTFGMKQPPRNIVSLMGAEYTEEFGQKKFTELSPRTLMRHLAVYEKDQRKRKQIVELSAGGMITRPDAELFYEFNIELMRSLYGEEYIQRLLKERLRSL